MDPDSSFNSILLADDPPQDMAASRWPWRLGLIAALYAVAEVALVVMFETAANGTWFGPLASAFVSIAALAMIMGQTIVLTGWLALGDGPWLLRLGVLLAAILSIHGLLSWLLSPFPITEFLVVAAGQVVFVGVPLAIARWFGWVCRRSTSASRRQSWQYSLGQIVLLTVIVAVAMRAILLLQLEDVQAELQELAAFTVAISLLGLLAWPVVMQLKLPLSIAVMVMVAGLAGTVLLGVLGEEEVESLLLLAAEGIVLLVVLRGIRWSGYRLWRE